MRAQAVAPAEQILPQIAIVIDFAVKDDPNGLVFIGDGLVPGMKIDDTEPAHAEGTAAIQMKAFVIRSAVTNRGAHSLNVGKLSGPAAKDETGDAAH